MPSKRVFISYSSLDKPTADKVCESLEDQGIDCWIAPRNVLPGAKYAESIVLAIEQSSAVVLLFSSHSNKSEQVLNEVERAVSKKKRIFTLKISQANLSTELEYFISRHQWLDATESSLNACVKQLAAALTITVDDAFHPLPEQEPKKPWYFRRIPIFLGIGIILVFIVLVAVSFISKTITPPTLDSKLLSTAYQALEAKEWSAAETSFQQLIAHETKISQSEGYAGLAALAYAQGRYKQALNYAKQAETLNPEIVYSHVIRGHVLLEQGKLEEAAVEYRTATEHAGTLPWQKAIAHNRLGRIEAVQGRPQNALQHYDQAIAQNESLAVAYANKGYMLEKLGKTEAALDLYRQALQLDPDDDITASLLYEAERRSQAAQDKAKQQVVDKLVSELVQLHKEGKARPAPEDSWTSAPLTLWIVNFKLKGALASREGEAEFFLLKLTDALRKTKRVAVVDRAILDKLLTELKLGASELTDPQTALRVGKILAARLISTCSFTRFDTEGQLTMRVVETETTRSIASVAEIINTSQPIDDVMDHLTEILLEKLREAYPIQCRIARTTEQGVILNIGSEQGVTPGLTLEVYANEEQPATHAQKAVEFPNEAVATIEVTKVDKTLSRATVIEQMETLQAGQKAREVIMN